MKGDPEYEPQYPPQPVVHATVVQGLPVQAQAMAAPVAVQAVAVQPMQPVQPLIVQPVPSQPVQFPAEITPPSEWSQGICGCCSHKDCGCMCCLASTCFSCCFYPTLEQEAGVPNGFGGWAPTCITLCGLPDMALGAVGCPPVINAVARYFLRRGAVKRYNIQESELSSFCWCCWCGWCSMVQQTNEMMVRKHLIFDGPFKVRDDPGPRPPISMGEVPSPHRMNRA